MHRLWQSLFFWKRISRRLQILLLVALLGGAGLAGMHGWAWYHYQAAATALREKRFEDAQAHIDSCLPIWRGGPDTLRLAARVARYNGAYDQAEKYLEECRRRENRTTEPTRVEWLLLRAQRGELDDVSDLLRKAILTNHPDWEAMIEMLCVGYVRTENYEQALPALNYWLEKNPDAVSALSLRAHVHNNRGAIKETIADYERAVELDPKDAAIRVRLCAVLTISRDLERASFHGTYLVKHHPEVCDGWVELARCRKMQGDLDEAASLLDHALGLEPDKINALILRAEIAAFQDRPAAAAPWLRRAVKLEPFDSQILELWHRCLQDQGKDAEEELKTVRDRWDAVRATNSKIRKLQHEAHETPLTPDKCYELAELYEAIGKENLTFYWIHHIVRMDPNHEKANRWLAQYYEKDNQPTKAAVYRTRANAATRVSGGSSSSPPPK